MYQKAMIIYCLILGTLLTILGFKIAFQPSKSDTIVVDASAYIEKELKASTLRVEELDFKYKELFFDMVQNYRQMDSLKMSITKRNKTIDYLKIKITQNETSINDINLSDAQHDSLFARFLKDPTPKD